MQPLAQYVMDHRSKAIFAAMILATLPLALAQWLALAVLALVTLVKGPRQSALVLAWMVLPSLALALTILPYLLWDFLLFGAVFTWLLAGLFYYTRSWIVLLECGTCLSILAVWGLHGWYPNLTEEWVPRLREVYTALTDMMEGPAPDVDVEQLLRQQAFYATGTYAAIYLMRAVFAVAIGRYMQSLLYNPGGFREEFLALRLGKVSAVVMTMLLLAAALGVVYPMYALPVLLIPCLVLIMSMMHSLSSMVQPGWLSLTMLYGTFLLFLPQSFAVWVSLVVLDPLVDLRNKLKHMVN